MKSNVILYISFCELQNLQPIDTLVTINERMHLPDNVNYYKFNSLLSYDKFTCNNTFVRKHAPILYGTIIFIFSFGPVSYPMANSEIFTNSQSYISSNPIDSYVEFHS
jgi:hypothetical protein